MDRFIHVYYKYLNISGPEFLIEDRYAQILNVIYITMMYSSGLPILYLVSSITLFLFYFIDKVMCKLF